MSRISSFTETIGFISPHSCCETVADGAGGGAAACFGAEQEEVTTAKANTPVKTARSLCAVMNVTAAVYSDRSA